MAKEGSSDKKKYVILYRRHKSDEHEFGSGFYIMRYVMDNLLHFESINERICKLRFNLNTTI